MLFLACHHVVVWFWACGVLFVGAIVIITSLVMWCCLHDAILNLFEFWCYDVVLF